MIPMLLWCPACGARHIDAGEFATKPHHTHACQACGMVWRPAVVETVGVDFLPGFKDPGLVGGDLSALDIPEHRADPTGWQLVNAQVPVPVVLSFPGAGSFRADTGARIVIQFKTMDLAILLRWAQEILSNAKGPPAPASVADLGPIEGADEAIARMFQNATWWPKPKDVRERLLPKGCCCVSGCVFGTTTVCPACPHHGSDPRAPHLATGHEKSPSTEPEP